MINMRLWKKNKKNKEKETMMQNEQQLFPISGSMCFSTSLPNKAVNEDAHLYIKTNSGLFVFAVADGLGSYSAAAEASKQTIKYVEQHADLLIELDNELLLEFFRDINNHLCELAKGEKYKQLDGKKGVMDKCESIF